MKSILFLSVAILFAITSATNITNETTSILDDLPVDGEDESFYTIDVLLTADDTLNGKFG